IPRARASTSPVARKIASATVSRTATRRNGRPRIRGTLRTRSGGSQRSTVRALDVRDGPRGSCAARRVPPMLFNSLEFVVFLLVVPAAYFLAIPRQAWRPRKLFLLAASYVFYVSWNPFFGLLLAGSTLLDFVLAQLLEREERPVARRALLAVSVAVNL